MRIQDRLEVFCLDDSSVKERTLEELELDYNWNIQEFIENLDKRIEIGKYFNNKYSYIFELFPIDYFEKQKNVLLSLKVSDYDKYLKISECDNTDNASEYDIVNKAYHYNYGKYECIDVMKEVFGKEKLKIWCILNAFKYIYRCYRKNGDQDLEKATYYLNYIKENLIDKENN